MMGMSIWLTMEVRRVVIEMMIQIERGERKLMEVTRDISLSSNDSKLEED